MRLNIQDGEDPFTRLEREKAERVKGNAKRQAKNLAETSSSSGAAASIPATVKLSTKLDAASARGQIAKGVASFVAVAGCAHSSHQQQPAACSF